jgi:membrane-bound ClpP family serine protease
MDSQPHSTQRRALVAIVLMTVGVVALLANNIAQGWTTLGTVGTVCLLVAIAAVTIQLRGATATG